MSNSPSLKNVTRSDGKASKQAILEATLRIILRDGIRSVKYRTVAEVAGVTPSATAYYFKDIQDLIKESFLYYLHSYKQEMEATRKIGETILDQYKTENLQKSQVKVRIIEQYTEALMGTIASDHPQAATFMLLDRIFRNETLQNTSLYGVLKLQDELDIKAIRAFFEPFKTSDPEADAVHLMSVLWFFSERLLQNGYTQDQKDYATKMIRNILEQKLLD